MIKRKKTDIVQFKIRLTEELRKQLETAARTEGRSLNTEMVRRLEASLASGMLLPDFARAARQMAEQWERLAKQGGADPESSNRGTDEIADLGQDPKPGSKWGKL